MRIVFNELGVITSHNFSEQGDSLRQGSVGNVLVAKLTNAINANLIATLNFTRPDGSAITNVLMDNQGTDEFKIKFSDPWYFALSGNATLTIFVRDSGGNIAAQGQVQVPIESTDYDGDSVAPITNAQYTELLSRIAGKMNRTGESEIGDALSFVDDENNTVFSWTKSNGGQFHVPMSFSTIEVATLTINGYAAATESYVNGLLQSYAEKTYVENLVTTSLEPYATKNYVQTELLPYATKSYVLEKINEIVLDPFELKTDATSKYNELNGKIADVRAVAEGKTKSYTISTEDNASFNSQNASLSGVTSIKDISGNVIQVSSLKNGDVVLVVEIDVPDRWYSSADGKFYILETAKVDLSPYSAHIANGDIHVTSSDKSGWNTHVADTTIHVTAADKTNWNGKSVVSGSGTGSSTTPISYITINGVEYAIVPAHLNAVWGQISGSIANQTDLKNALDAKQDKIDSSHKLDADLVDDSSSTHKFVSATDKTNWDAKQDKIDSSHKLDADLVDDSSSTHKFVSATDKTNWDAKQSALTFDSTPTQNSSNPVTSGGVYTECKNIREVAEGKCKSYVIDTQSQITGTKDANDEYTGVTAITGVTLADLKIGDVILIKELNKPDYWVSALVFSGDVLQSVSLNKMETTKVEVGTKLYKHTITFKTDPASSFFHTLIVINKSATPLTNSSITFFTDPDLISIKYNQGYEIGVGVLYANREGSTLYIVKPAFSSGHAVNFDTIVNINSWQDTVTAL